MEKLWSLVQFDLSTLFAFSLSNITDAVTSYLHNPIADTPILGILVDGHLLLETILVVVIVGLMFQKSYKPDNRPLTEKEIDQLCEEWQPEPLHPPLPKEVLEYEPPVLESAAGPRTVVDGKDVLNLTSTNLLGLVGNKNINEAATAALEKYGVGSCGPRGFYGTIDVHMDLEEKVAKFMGVDDCILYSFGLATASSTIPAFCKRGDLILADEGVTWSIQNGLSLSRSTVRFFRHNDMADLEKKLREVKAEDAKKRKALNRRFIVVEAIYQNSGQMAPLDQIMRLKDKYKFRVMVDESLSFGVLGKTGRGISEHFGIDAKRLDIIVAGMGNALASVGGFCCGDAFMVDHQRLSGLGYCFSASLPPFLASAAIAALHEVQEHPELRSTLARNVAAFRKAAEGIPGLTLGADPSSPLILLHLKKSSGSFADDCKLLQQIVDQMWHQEGVLVGVTKRTPLDRCRLPAGIRIAVSAGHSEEELVAAAASLKKVATGVL